MKRKYIWFVAGLAAAVLGVGIMVAQEKKAAAKGPDRDADKAAIEKLSKDFIEAFNNRDAAAIATHWTDGGEFIRNDGLPIRGRDEVQKGYAEFFKTLKGKPKIEVQLDNLRFPSNDSAVLEVTLRLKSEEGDIIASSWRNTLLMREEGKWKVAMVQEWDRDESIDVSIDELAWLVGTWHMENEGREVNTTYEWDENKKYIRGKYEVKEGGKVVESGTQMMCKDNSALAIHSWVFMSDGGFGDGLWTREGKRWTVDVSGVTPDGRELTATAIYVHVDANTYTWQSIDQAVDGVPIPDTKPVKITKQKGK